MAKLWKGRMDGEGSPLAEKFNSSIGVDGRMFKEDIMGSIAHAEMLKIQGIIDNKSANQIIAELKQIYEDIASKKLAIDETAEDIHTFVEQELTKRIGNAGKMLHTARSRNDQVALDMRMHLKKEIYEIITLISTVVDVLKAKAEENLNTVMPGFTHLQKAQPVTLAQHFMAYVFMLLRDADRLADGYKRTSVSPIGSCALAGTTYPIDRVYEADLLGFSKVAANSMDAVSDRDFCLEFMSAASILMMHLSRFSEELIIWSTDEFNFIKFSDAFSTGSSIMPQKKNPDMAELIRGKTGRVYGNMVALFTVMKGLPLAYNKDMQEDKESLFDTIDTLKDCLNLMAPMIEEMEINKNSMRESAEGGYINATDLADYLAKKGVPFRDAYKITGEIVAGSIEKGKKLSELSIEEYKKYSDVFESDLLEAIDIETCVNNRSSQGGPSPASVLEQLKIADLEMKSIIEKLN